MANVTLWGASYSDVPAIQVPKTGGGVAAFHDVTDTTAVAADVATGKYFHAADGTLTEGTSSGGGGVTVEALSVTSNGTYTAPAGTAYSPVTVNVSGGGVDLDDIFTKTYQFGDVVLDTATSLQDIPLFKGQPGLTGITASEMTTAGSTGASQLFEGCANLIYAFFPKATTVGRDACRNCAKFEYFAAPMATTIGNESFRQSSKLKVVDLGMVSDLGTRFFYNATYTADIVLRKTSVVTIAANAVPSTGSSVHVYVPSSLISSYEQATNWSTGVSSGTVSFYALENSAYESTDWWESV